MSTYSETLGFQELQITTEIPESQLYEVSQILFNEGVRGVAGTLLFDLDDTLKGKRDELHTFPDGGMERVSPHAVSYLHQARGHGLNIGIATEQTVSEMAPFLRVLSQGSRVGHTDLAISELLNGPVVGEGGAVIGFDKNSMRVIAPKASIAERTQLFAWLERYKQLTPSAEVDGWFKLAHVDPQQGTLVRIPDLGYYATGSIHEKGPRISEDESFIIRYGQVKRRIDQILKRKGWSHITTQEAGNGTLRVRSPYVTKHHTLGLMHAYGITDLGRAVYFCDGPNDIDLAKKIRSKGGAVVAVANAVPELKTEATIVSDQKVGNGVATVLSQVFRYAQEMGMIRDPVSG